MFRKILTFALVAALLAPATLSAERDQSQPATPAKSSSKRAIWTIIGAGAGFAAGVFIGLNQFDDATNSDRKVWTTAIIGAAGGGLAGNLLSRNVGRAPSTRSTAVAAPQAPIAVRFPQFDQASSRRDRDAELLTRVRSLER